MEYKFNNSTVDEILITPEKKIIVLKKSSSSKNKEIYENFFEQFSLFLSKLPNNNVKKYVQEVYNRNLIYIGDSDIVTADNIPARILLNNSMSKLKRIILNSKKLEIDITSGETVNIDDCIYVVYYSLIRSAILINRSKIKSDKKLHKLLTTYMYLIFIKSLGKNSIFSKKQKLLIHLSCIYIYYIYFFNEKHSYSLSIVKRDYMDLFDKEIYQEFYDLIKDNKGYSTIKDIPKLLIDLKIIFKDPKIIYLELIRLLKPIGFYTFIGPFDQFVASMVITKYPTSLFSKYGITNLNIHSHVEDIIDKMIRKIPYDKN